MICCLGAFKPLRIATVSVLLTMAPPAPSIVLVLVTGLLQTPKEERKDRGTITQVLISNLGWEVTLPLLEY